MTAGAARTPPRARRLAESLLDGSRPIGAASVRAVDDALASGSAEPLLHACALWLAHRTGGDLRLERSDPRRWSLGLDALVDLGRLDVAAHAAPRLNETYPWIPYLEHMAVILRRMPAASQDPRRELFVDDLASDAQVVRRDGAGTLLLAFCGNRHRLGLALNLVDRWVAQLDVHVAYLRDWDRAGFEGGIASLGRGLDATVARLDALAVELGAARVVCIGASAGGTGALRYAPLVGASRVLALSPVTGGPDARPEPGTTTGAGLGDLPWPDLVPLMRRPSGVDVRVIYGADHEGDREQALRLQGLPAVRIEALPGVDTHHMVPALIRVGRLKRVLHWLVNGDPQPEQTGSSTPAAVPTTVAAPTLATSPGRPRARSLVGGLARRLGVRR